MPELRWLVQSEFNLIYLKSGLGWDKNTTVQLQWSITECGVATTRKEGLLLAEPFNTTTNTDLLPEYFCESYITLYYIPDQ